MVYRRKERYFEGAILPQENVILHKAALIQLKGEQLEWKISDHPSFILDPSLCNLHVCGMLEEALEG